MDTLSPGELQVWHACKALGDGITRSVAAELTAAVGLSGSEYGLLTQLDELGGGRLGQQALAHAMRWANSRMSHQLTRMALRGIVQREKGANGVDVVLTPEGRDLLARARPIHTAAVRAYLTDRLSESEQALLVQIAGRLTNPEAAG